MLLAISQITLAALALLYPVNAQSREPAIFQPNPNKVGSGSGLSGPKDSAHFRVYGGGAKSDAILRELEGAYSCFVNDLGWRSSGLSRNAQNDNGPWYKLNVYVRGSIGGAAGVLKTASGYGYLEAITSQAADPRVIVHEFGHALTYHEKHWVDQGRTGTWWEPVANWFADTYLTSPLCAQARAAHGRPTEGPTLIELNKVLGSSHQVIVDGSVGSGNYYQSWPLITYLTNNPDKIPNLGKDTLQKMIRQYRRGSNDTPLHALQIVAGSTPVSKIVGRYWARMAYVDIGHKQAQAKFNQIRSRINYANLDRNGNGYTVKPARAPRYMGASIIPLRGNGKISVKVTADKQFTATLAVKGSGRVRYLEALDGAGALSTTLATGEEATLVVANTPSQLIQYDGFRIGGAVAEGLNFSLQLTGAIPYSAP